MKPLKLVLADADGNVLETVCYLPSNVVRGQKMLRPEQEFILEKVEAAVAHATKEESDGKA